MSNKLHLSKEQQDAHLAMWEDQFDMQADETLPTGEAALEAARARNETQNTNPETNERPANEPTKVVEAQIARIADMSHFTPYSGADGEQSLTAITDRIRHGTTSNSEAAPESEVQPEAGLTDEVSENTYTSRIANGANTVSEKLSAFAETYDKEGAKGLASKALKRIGRAVASPIRNQASAFSEAITEEVDENDPLEAYTKESARVIDWTAEKVTGNGDSKLRTFVANKLYDKAASVDDREGNYKSRSIDRVNNGIDTAKYMLAAAHDAKERRKNRVKKQHFRTIGRKLVAYHTAGREAAKNMNKKETLPPKEVTQKDFELVG